MMRGRLSAVFGGGPDKAAQKARREAVKTWAREALVESADVAITVNEIVCTDPGCPGVETVILVMVPGEKTRAVKVPLALDEVTREAVLAALEA